MNIEPDASHTPDVLRDVLGEIEVLRMKRQEEGRDRPHPFLKRFTQQELTDEACPTYKNLLVGRSQRIPSRQTLMQIADYLECSMESRNNLLLAARYLASKPRIGRRRAQAHIRTGQAVDGNTPLSSHACDAHPGHRSSQRAFPAILCVSSTHGASTNTTVRPPRLFSRGLADPRTFELQ
jgi:hypothetical protein